MQPTHAQTTPIQLGGAKFQQSLMEWSKESFSVFNGIFLLSFFLFAAYSHQIPASIRYQASSTLGRLLTIVLLVVIYESAGWIPALLFTIGVAILWTTRPLAQPANFTHPAGSRTNVKAKEGFEGGVKTSVNQSGFRWFVERVLHENPKGVQEDRIAIGDVQTDNVVGNERTSK